MKRNPKIVAAVTPIGDAVRFNTKTGEYTVKRGFFYRHGFDAGQMAAAISRAVPGATITHKQEHYNAWPRDSYWVVRFTVPEAK